MPDYLEIPLHRRERVVHEKARARRRGELTWIRSYLTDLLDDEGLYGEPPIVQFLDVAIVHLGARSGWLVPADSVQIAGRFGFRGREVKPAIQRLLELGRFNLIAALDLGKTDGTIQPALFPVTPRGTPGSTPAALRQHSGTTIGSIRPTLSTAQPRPPEPPAASRPLAQSREEKRREEKQAEQRVTRDESPACLPGDNVPTRLADLGLNQAQIRAAIADRERALAWLDYVFTEPALQNPGGYLVTQLRTRDHWPPGGKPKPQPTTQELETKLRRWVTVVGRHYPPAAFLEETAKTFAALPEPARLAVYAAVVEPEL